MIASLRAWLDGREPPPPADLRHRLFEALEAASAAKGGRGPEGTPEMDDASDIEGTSEADGVKPDRSTVEVLLAAAESSLESAVSRPGRVRESAFDLLVADALITYACEAALETDAPERALASVLAVGAST